MAFIDKTTDIAADVHDVYELWAAFEDYPTFMETIETVTVVPDDQLHWVAVVEDDIFEWDAEIVEHVTDEKITWRAIDGRDFRTDAIRTVDLWNYFTSTPNRVWSQEDSGFANPWADGWLELPANHKRVYALWAIVRGWSRSVYAAPSLSSALGMGMCSIPFMIVDHRV